MINRNQENYSSFETFQQLINDVYESDQRENMLDLFQRYFYDDDPSYLQQLLVLL